jgi:hypothetical protein
MKKINNKFTKFIREISYYKSALPKKYTKYFDEIASLYLDRKIEKKSEVHKILTKFMGRGTAANSAIKLLENKYRDAFPVTGIKTNKQDFFITANIKRTINYRNDRNQLYEMKDVMIQANKYFAQSLEEAKHLAKKAIHRESFNSKISGEKKWTDRDTIDSTEDIDYDIDDIDFSDSLNESEMHGKVAELQWLEASSEIVDYNWIPEERKYLNIDDKKCVEDNLFGIYSPHIKKVTIEYIRKLASKFYEEEDFEWTYKNGYNAKFIHYFCEKHNISMYAFDITNKCFLKNVTKTHRKYPALFFYAISGHMYLVKDEKRCKEMMERAKDNVENFNTSLVEIIQKENIFNTFKDYNEETKETTYKIEENIDAKDITKFESRIFIYSSPERNNINDIFKDCIHLYGIPSTKSIVSDRVNITRFEYMIHNQLYIFMLDPNDCIHVNYKMVMYYCIKNNVEFKNQTFPQFIRELKEIHIKNKSKREEISTEIKDKLKLKQKNKCAYCEDELKTFECDHIRALANGGTNDFLNLQLLCKSCHHDKSKHEVEDGSYVRIVDTESSFNEQTTEIIHSDLNKHLAFVEYVEDPLLKLKNKTVFCIDINKCRKNILYFSEHNFPIFTVMDEIKEFNKDKMKTCGWYYVNTRQHFPLHGNGWYSYPLVKYCLDENLIKFENIQFVLEPSLELNHDYFNSFIDECYNNKSLDKTNEKLYEIYNEMENTMDIVDPQKLAINSMIGGFKPSLNRNKRWKSLCITSKSTEAYQYYLKNDGCFIKIIKTEKDQIFYHVFKEYIKTNIETEQPIYDQILDIEAIELHKLSKIIESKNGIVLDLKTDCISCIFPDNKFPFDLIDDKNLKHYYWDENNTLPKYKIESGKRLEVERSPKLIRKEKYNYYVEDVEYYKDVNDNDFDPLVARVLKAKSSFFITGPPGSGKSTLINKLKIKLEEMNKTYECLTPTNLSALIIGGKTVHKFVNKIKKMESIYKLKYDYIFVDEISMVKECFYKFLLTIKRIKPNIMFIVSGDFQQFSPINDRSNFNYKDSLALKELTDFSTLQLTKCRRSDDKLFNLCKFENIMNIDKTQFSNKNKKINLCFTNEKRIAVNKLCMDRFRPENYITLTKNKANCQSQDIYLYEGLPVICKVSDEKETLNNNEQFIVTKYDFETVTIKSIIDERILDINIFKFNKIFFPAYAITVYASQGCTINQPYTIHEYERLNRRARYVALSRSSKLEFINIK